MSFAAIFAIGSGAYGYPCPLLGGCSDEAPWLGGARLRGGCSSRLEPTGQVRIVVPGADVGGAGDDQRNPLRADVLRCVLDRSRDRGSRLLWLGGRGRESGPRPWVAQGDGPGALLTFLPLCIARGSPVRGADWRAGRTLRAPYQHAWRWGRSWGWAKSRRG
jgi:hypothetical protein